MFISVNKKTNNRKAVTYSALSSGTISHVWCDEDSLSATTPRRQNRIKLTREMMPVTSATIDAHNA
jgi:hypothetical protein